VACPAGQELDSRYPPWQRPRPQIGAVTRSGERQYRPHDLWPRMQGIGDTTQARGDIGLRGVPDQVDGGDQVDPVGADPLHVQIADPFDLVVVDEGP